MDVEETVEEEEEEDRGREDEGETKTPTNGADGLTYWEGCGGRGSGGGSLSMEMVEISERSISVGSLSSTA